MKLESYSKVLTWLMPSLFAVLVVGCGGGGGGGWGSPAPGGGSPAPGTLGVSLTDAPACGFDAVNVTVTKVRVHQSSSASDTDAGWTDITLNPARKINLLSLNNGVLDSLGETPLAAGHYTQLRLVLDPNTAVGLTNSVVPTGGVETALVTPSAVQSGIKLVNAFDVVSGQRVDLVLDFDACKSIVKRGNGTYALKPVIKVIPFVKNGIDGFVDAALLGSNVMVTAQQNGVIVQSTAPNATTGEFFLARLAPGNYDVVLTADSHATAVIATVPVASITSVTDISTTGARITLPTSVVNHTISGTAILNPTNSDVVAYATAKQTFGTAPIVTVKFVAADDLAGTYSLTLPADAPLFVQYSTTLPIVPLAQAGVAGQYTIEASASGYTTQSVSKNISAADVTQSFVITTPPTHPTIVFDYSHDTNGFFTPQVRALMDSAAAVFTSRISGTQWARIDTSTTGGSYDLAFIDPSTLAVTWINNAVIPENQITIHVGAIDFTKAPISQMQSSSGDGASQLLSMRNVSGGIASVLTSSSQLRPIDASITFDLQGIKGFSSAINRQWYFSAPGSFPTDYPSTSDPHVNDYSDFWTTAVHEIGHVLGIYYPGVFNAYIVSDPNLNLAWTSKVQSSGSGYVFTGAFAKEMYYNHVGQNIPLEAADKSHWATGVRSQTATGYVSVTHESDGQFRKTFSELEFQALRDLGYTISTAP